MQIFFENYEDYTAFAEKKNEKKYFGGNPKHV